MQLLSTSKFYWHHCTSQELMQQVNPSLVNYGKPDMYEYNWLYFIRFLPCLVSDSFKERLSHFQLDSIVLYSLHLSLSQQDKIIHTTSPLVAKDNPGWCTLTLIALSQVCVYSIFCVNYSIWCLSAPDPHTELLSDSQHEQRQSNFLSHFTFSNWQ
jgi:hypothetical protein